MTLGTFIVGIIILIGGIIFMKYYQQVADNFGSGVSSYSRYKLAALLVCATGIIIMFGIHIYILNFIAGLFPRL